MKPIKGIEPPDGHHYIQKWNGGSFRIDAETPDNLIDAVKRFRLENNIPVGDVESDVNTFTCNRVPNFCRPDGIVPAGAPTPRPIMLVDRVLEHGIKHQLSDIVFRAEAELRAKCCVGCKFNVEWKLRCSDCFQRAERLGLTLRKGNDIAVEGKLMACSLVGQDNRTAIWLKEKEKRPENAPAECWL